MSKLPKDLEKSLTKSTKVYTLWETLTPIGKRDFVGWILQAKLEETRKHRIERLSEMLLEGKRRPCCYARTVLRKALK